MEHNDDGADADNENTVVYNRKDMSMANAGRKSTRLNRTARKHNRQNKNSIDEGAMSAAEMDELDEQKA